jgi:hypothetical protein
MKKQSVHLAKFESRNFVFEGCGATEAEARDALSGALRAHCRRTGARLAEFFYPDDVQVRELTVGAGFIDGDEIKPGSKR